MTKPKKVKTVAEVTGGELLSNEDYNHIASAWFETPPKEAYTLEYPGFWDKFSPRSLLDSSEPFIDKKCASSDFRIDMPLIKNCLIEELATKWWHPNLYSIVAGKNYDHMNVPERLQYFVPLYAKAAELYKALVLELQPLFKEEDWETVKYRMLGETVGECIRRMSYKLTECLRGDIKSKKEMFGITKIPDRTIEIWTQQVNLMAAWAAEARPYCKALQLYRHNRDCKRVKDGLMSSITFGHPDDKNSLRQWNLSVYATKILVAFKKERALALNPPPSPYEVISVKVHPATLMFAHGAQKASKLIDSICTPSVSAYDDECVNLLGQLEGYNPKYTAPKAASANSLDKDIMLQEKLSMQSLGHLDELNIEGLLQATKDAIKLLSLVYMRYKMTLEAKDESTYFDFFRSASSIDKDSYYEIFAFYMDNIFQKCLPALLKLTIAHSDVYKDELKSSMEAVNALIEFSHDISRIDSPAAIRTVKMLDGIQDLCGHVNIITGRNDVSTGLRHRHLIKS